MTMTSKFRMCFASRTSLSNSACSAACPRRSLWRHCSWTASASASSPSSSGISSGWAHACAHEVMSSSLGICWPRSSFGTRVRDFHPRFAASCAPVSPASLRKRFRRSARPPGWFSVSPVGCKAVLRSGGGELFRRGGDTDCQVPPFAMQGDDAGSDDELLRVHLPFLGVVQQDHALVIEQPPVAIQRQAVEDRGAAGNVTDLLTCAYMPRERPESPLLIVGGRLRDDSHP